MIDDLTRALAGSVLGWSALALLLSGVGLALVLGAQPPRRRRHGGAPLEWEWSIPGWSGIVLVSSIAAAALSGAALLAERWTAALGVWGVLAAVLRLGAWGLRRWYCRRLRRQVVPALVQLTALVTGSSSLLRAFRSVAQTAAWPLADEWRWVDRQVGTSALVLDRHGQRRLQAITHADALTALARRTPDPLHAQALAALAAVYERGGESAAAVRLAALTAALQQAEAAQHAVARASQRVIGQATIIVGAVGVVAIWLAVSQTELVQRAFGASPYAVPALVWFLGWIAAPFVAAWLATRMDDWPV